MSRKDLDFFRKLLNRRLKELLMEAEKTKNMVKATDELAPDPVDAAFDQSEKDFLLRLRDRESKLMAKIKEALEKIDNGTFGVCEECGEGISLKRLRARPMATLCIDCKHEQETLERKNGLEGTTELSPLWSHG
jgi:DnaK suppressor protein